MSKGNGPNGASTQVTITRILSAAPTKNISDSFYDVAVFGCYITYMYAYVPIPAVRSQIGSLSGLKRLFGLDIEGSVGSRVLELYKYQSSFRMKNGG